MLSPCCAQRALSMRASSGPVQPPAEIAYTKLVVKRTKTLNPQLSTLNPARSRLGRRVIPCRGRAQMAAVPVIAGGQSQRCTMSTDAQESEPAQLRGEPAKLERRKSTMELTSPSTISVSSVRFLHLPALLLLRRLLLLGPRVHSQAYPAMPCSRGSMASFPPRKPCLVPGPPCACTSFGVFCSFESANLRVRCVAWCNRQRRMTP